MQNILSIVENATNGSCYTSYRYSADDEKRVPTIAYDETSRFTLLKDRYGETDTTLKTPKDLTSFAERIQSNKPLFRFFLDGSRRTYKVDDLEINRRIFPIMAGQIAVACCERKSPNHFGVAELENHMVICLPTEANPEPINKDLFLNNLKKKINEIDRVKMTGIGFSSICTYESKYKPEKPEEASEYESLGIAAIQDEMIDREKKIVASMTARNLLNEDSYLLKDGSIQYKPMKTGEYRETSKIKNNYRWVIGISKMFNPEFSRDKAGKSNAAALAKLPLFHRTPVYMHEPSIEQRERLGDFKFSIWYVRVRDASRTDTPFAGILKIEKILLTEQENEKGLDTELVDIITANIINERNPVCYGSDKRWANHLYPVYLTESFLKSKFLSDLYFLNLF